MGCKTWDDVDDAVSSGPGGTFKVLLGGLLLLLLLGSILSVVGYCSGWFGETAQVAKEEFGPRAMLAKYEWFKDASATLDKKRADVEVYQTRMASLENSYGKQTPRTGWAREDREQFNVWSSELAGVKASYNSLAAEYNAGMAKFNWAFANAGDLPRRADVPLPREYKPYSVE